VLIEVVLLDDVTKPTIQAVFAQALQQSVTTSALNGR
jgi:hypothetical protein